MYGVIDGDFEFVRIIERFDSNWRESTVFIYFFIRNHDAVMRMILRGLTH